MSDQERIQRTVVPALDEILGTKLPVLDDGFVRLIDYMGTDSSIVQAARISYGAGTKTPSSDRTLIRYLLRHRHTTPFEMCEIKFHVRVPMDTWRQWIRHRTASVNEYSTRYSVAIDSTQTTNADAWRLQSESRKQGSEGVVDSAAGSHLSSRERELHEFSRAVYAERLSAGIAREQARKDLPLSTYTEAYWKIDLHNLLHFLELRLAANAQHEIRAYAHRIAEVLQRWCPLTWEAFTNYRLDAALLSGVETGIVQKLASGDIQGALQAAKSAGFFAKDGIALSREGTEFEEKLLRLGLLPVWLNARET